MAHQSCALIEADERGLYEELSIEYPCEESAIADALWYCDMTTSPDGDRLPASSRLDEIKMRYGPDHVVTRPSLVRKLRFLRPFTERRTGSSA